MKYNTSGVLQWTVTYNSPYNNEDQISAIAVDASGNIILSGSSQYAPPGGNTSWVLSTVKYSPAGVLLWAVQTGFGQSGNYGFAMTTDAAGNIYLAGLTMDTAGSTGDYLVLKLNAGGVQQWLSTYNGSGNGNDVANAIAVDAEGNVFVTGQSEGLVEKRGANGGITFVQNGYDYVTIATPVNEYQQAGTHTVPFRSGRLAAGVYVYRIVASSSSGNMQATKQMVVE